MKLPGSTKNKITKDKNGENVSHFEITEVALVHVILLIMITNNIQEYYISFGSLLEISAKNHIFWKTFNSEYDEIKVWFTNQNSQVLAIEDIIKSNMVIK